MKLRREMFYSQKAFLPTSPCFHTLQAFEDALEGALLFLCFLPFTFFKNIFQVHLKTHFSFLSFPGSLFFFSFNIFQVYLKVIFFFYLYIFQVHLKVHLFSFFFYFYISRCILRPLYLFFFSFYIFQVFSFNILLELH